MLDELDKDKLVEAALAILSLSKHSAGATGHFAVWKSLDWDLTDDLHARGWIDDPRNKAKSVLLTDEGVQRAAEFLAKHFGKG